MSWAPKKVYSLIHLICMYHMVPWYMVPGINGTLRLGISLYIYIYIY